MELSKRIAEENLDECGFFIDPENPYIARNRRYPTRSVRYKCQICCELVNQSRANHESTSAIGASRDADLLGVNRNPEWSIVERRGPTAKRLPPQSLPWRYRADSNFRTRGIADNRPIRRL